jgi:hypothetical protein
MAAITDQSPAARDGFLSSPIRRGVTSVASAIIANAIHGFSARPSIAGSGIILTTVFISSRYRRS